VIFGSDRAKVHAEVDEELALRDFGNAGPLRMVLPFADAIAKFFATPSTFVPTSVSDIIAPGALTAFRGAMDLTHFDFKKKAESK
jgi:hypothetical protein